MRGTIRIKQEDITGTVAGKTETSGSDPFVHRRLLQLSQKCAVSVHMRSTYSERQSKMLARSVERNSILVNAGNGTERVSDVMAKSDDLMPSLKESELSKENLERKLSRQDVIATAMMASIR